MKVEIKNIESRELIMNIEDVKDVSEGCSGMLFVETESKNILYKVRQDECVVIIK